MSAGLYGKYDGLVKTETGQEVEGWYFVIRELDPHGWAALLAYADSCEQENPELAQDLRQHVNDERLMQGLYDSQWER